VEIVDYLKGARNRLWIIVVIPLLAAAGVLGHWQLTAKSYDATAYVFAPDALAGTGNQFSGPAGIANWVNQFSATAVSPKVTRRVAESTGVPATVIAQRLRVTQLHQSGQLEISFSWSDATVANAVVKHEAMATPKALFAPQVAVAKHAMAQTQDSLQGVNQNILDASTAWGYTRPDLLYTRSLAALVDLENARKDISAEDVAATAAADAKVTRAKARVAALQQDVVEFENLNAQRQAATTVLARAQENLQTTQAQYSGALGAVTVLPVRPAQLSSVLLKSVLAAVVAGLLIAFCLIAALELVGTSRDGRSKPTTPSKQTDRNPSKARTLSAPHPIGRNSKPVEPRSVRPGMVDLPAGRGDG
jgi:hypothetical protein